MASLYKRDRSPFWWVQFRDQRTGKVVQRSTGFRVGLAPDTRKAKELSAEKSLVEARTAGLRKEECWEQWVPTYFRARYAGSPSTLKRYQDVWTTVMMFLDERGIVGPRNLTREHCFAYLDWRSVPAKSEGRYNASHNTACQELKLLSMVVEEAVRRGYCSSNPCARLGIKRAPVREKPELTDEDIDFIRGKIELEPEPFRTFFRNSFEIGRYQGCRFSETYLNPCSDVELLPDGTGRIHFKRKGGKLDTVPLHPALVPLFRDLQASGARTTYEMPVNPSWRWYDFLKRIGMRERKPGICFHSLRVTAATRMARANVPEAKAMKFLSHASTVVHRVYQRLRVGDLDDCLNALE